MWVLLWPLEPWLTSLQNYDTTYADKWDAINLSLAPFGEEEIQERQEIAAEVTDPLYTTANQEADADGEPDGEAAGEGEAKRNSDGEDNLNEADS